ncbi:hypothetical protein [Pseudooceanicola marinus]|uniref:hypothetical protein n=1 Tax=Pseudooceanicola marinus TaxID=396013 RepID=UPI001C95FE81|nr:hypothetical protein [Pseudooceanicola marinus]MBY5971566.1 hypothetical protein [Ferrimonas balearica]MCA1335943.1 hypothetical protein [Pseudooceanicola marinus]
MSAPDPSPQTPPKKRKKIDAGLITLALICAASGAAVWVLHGPEVFTDTLLVELGFAAMLLPKVVGGILLAVALGYVLPRERILALAGPDSGVRGLAVATAAGALFPGGPAVTFALTAGLITSGADIAAGVAMVSGWVLLSANRTLIWELSFLPAHFVGLRVLMTLPVPILLGLAIRHVARRRAITGEAAE